MTLTNAPRLVRSSRRVPQVSLKDIANRFREMSSKYPVPVALYDIKSLSSSEIEAYLRVAPLILDYYKSRNLTWEKVKREGVKYTDYAGLVGLAGRISSEIVAGIDMALSDYVEPYQAEFTLTSRDLDFLKSLLELSGYARVQGWIFGIVLRPDSHVEVYAGGVWWKDSHPPVRARVILLDSKARTEAVTPVLPLEIISNATASGGELNVRVTIDAARGVVEAEWPTGSYTGSSPLLAPRIPDWPLPATLSKPLTSRYASFRIPEESTRMFTDLVEYYVVMKNMFPRTLIKNDSIMIDTLLLDSKHPVFSGLFTRGMVKAEEPVVFTLEEANGAANLFHEFLKRVKGPITGGVVELVAEKSIDRGLLDVVIEDKANNRLFTTPVYTRQAKIVRGALSTMRMLSNSLVGFIRVPRSRHFYYNVKPPLLVARLGDEYPGLGVMVASSRFVFTYPAGAAIILFPIRDNETRSLLADNYVFYKASEDQEEGGSLYPTIVYAVTGVLPVYTSSIRRIDSKVKSLLEYVKSSIDGLMRATIVVSGEWSGTERFKLVKGEPALLIDKGKSSLYVRVKSMKDERVAYNLVFHTIEGLVDGGEAPLGFKVAILPSADGAVRPIIIVEDEEENSVFILPSRSASHYLGKMISELR